MELAQLTKRSIFWIMAALLLAVTSGCREQPAAKPESTPAKENAKENNEKKTEKSAPASSEDKADQEAKAIREDLKEKISEELKKNQAKSGSEIVDQNKGIPATIPDDEMAAQKGKIDEQETVQDDKKEMTDQEIAEMHAKQRRTALKEIADSLGQPLVENADKLVKADKDYPVWFDKDKKEVVMLGKICQTNAPLEMFAVPSGTKEHEAIVAVPTEAFVVHALLLKAGAEPGKPVQFGPKESDYKSATGAEIEITVKWKNDKGETQTARAQEWIKNAKTGGDMKESWVFTGSGFWKDEQTGIEYYKAEGGDFICVSNFPSAMLDLPIESSQANDELMFQANHERIPPRGTPVTIILRPKGLTMSGAEPRSIIQEEEEEKLGVTPGP
jgi:hypothetical protein